MNEERINAYHLYPVMLHNQWTPSSVWPPDKDISSKNTPSEQCCKCQIMSIFTVTQRFSTKMLATNYDHYLSPKILISRKGHRIHVTVLFSNTELIHKVCWHISETLSIVLCQKSIYNSWYAMSSIVNHINNINFCMGIFYPCASEHLVREQSPGWFTLPHLQDRSVSRDWVWDSLGGMRKQRK